VVKEKMKEISSIADEMGMDVMLLDVPFRFVGICEPDNVVRLQKIVQSSLGAKSDIKAIVHACQEYAGGRKSLGELIGINEQTIGNWKAGYCKPSAEMMKKLNDLYFSKVVKPEKPQVVEPKIDPNDPKSALREFIKAKKEKAREAELAKQRERDRIEEAVRQQRENEIRQKEEMLRKHLKDELDRLKAENENLKDELKSKKIKFGDSPIVPGVVKSTVCGTPIPPGPTPPPVEKKIEPLAGDPFIPGYDRYQEGLNRALEYAGNMHRLSQELGLPYQNTVYAWFKFDRKPTQEQYHKVMNYLRDNAKVRYHIRRTEN
jgi:hypothetical protein